MLAMHASNFTHMQPAMQARCKEGEEGVPE
jgi:hypothetical protein